MKNLYLLLTICACHFVTEAYNAKEKKALQEKSQLETVIKFSNKKWNSKPNPAPIINFRRFKTKIRPVLRVETTGGKGALSPIHEIRCVSPKMVGRQNYNVHDAKAKLLKALTWRKENKIDDILAESPTFVDELLPYQIKAKDLLGNPVVTMDYNAWDVRRIALAGKLPIAYRHVTKMIESCVNKSREIEQYEPKANKWVLFANVQGFNLKKHGCLACIPLNLESVTTYENYYTGSLRYLIIINAPRSFDTLAGLARNIMSPGTRRAFKLYTNNKEEWDFLDTIIARSELPPRHGGTNKNF